MMSKEDNRCKNESWVGNIYQTFEAVCQEVDDIVTREHMKKLENHVQLVGDNVMKFCSNVRDLIPSSFGTPVKHVAESLNCVFELKDEDGECPSVLDDLHSDNNLQNLSFRNPIGLSSRLKLVQIDPFSVDQDYEDSRFEVEKRQSEISEFHFTDSYFADQGSKKQSPFDASESLFHERCLITGKSGSFTKGEEESLSSIPDLAFPDEDPCEEEKQSLQISDVIVSYGYFIDQSSEKHSLVDASELTCHEDLLSTEQSDSFIKKEDSLLSIPESAFPDEDPCEEEKQSSEISEVVFNDGYFIDQGYKKKSTFDASELTFHESYLITENSDSFTKKEEELVSNKPEFASPDEDTSEMSTSSTFYNQNHGPGDKLPIDVSPSAFEHILDSEFHQKEATVRDDRSGDRIHDNTQGSTFQLKEETMLDSLSKRFSDVPNETVPYSVLASSVTSSDSETSNVRLSSSISSPLLDYSDHQEIEFHPTAGPTYSNMAVEIGSTSTLALDFQSSEPFSCIVSPKENTENLGSSFLPSSSSLEFTEIPIISESDNGGGLELKQREIPIISPDVDKCWLRKKKVCVPFSSRKKLEKEYKQLAIWYCDIDAEFNEVPEERLVSSNKHQPAQDLQDSDWEIL